MAQVDVEMIFQGIRAVAGKATGDPAFRQLVVSDPRKAWLDVTGTAMPVQWDIRFQDQGKPSLTVIVGLPATAPGSGALPDEDLGSITGGEEVPNCTNFGNWMHLPGGPTR